MATRHAPASRSNGSPMLPCAQFIRFTEDQNIRLHRIRRQRGISIQAFCHAAIMRAVLAAESGSDDPDADQRKPSEPAGPRGLGIRERLEAEDAARAKRREPPEPPAPATAAPVTVNVGMSGGGAVSDVGPLARMVAESPDRRAAMESACRILAQGRSREEAFEVADQLTAAVKRIDAAPTTALERVRARVEARRR